MSHSVIDMSSAIGRETQSPAQRQAGKEANDPTNTECAHCKKPQSDLPGPLKRCGKCQKQFYCTRDCQKADWKAHKRTCASNQQNKPKATTDFDAMPQQAGDFFKGLVGNDFLHNLSEKDAYTQLIDCYRMRVEDDYKFACDNRGLYGGKDPRPDFGHFLNLAEKRKGLLPKWWSAEKRRGCEQLAVDASQWSDINCAVEKHDITEHYGDGMMPMKLRLLAEKVYGKKIDMGY